ncbi:hypothetical protein IQ216_01555 [Cyanobium sp. LEGE 06143]|uniref:hypothetical protein n=1 Tax=Cyanobium sp. LEGE 06143 TaxID=945727 RepID=UPI001880809D|nr:hypothetical protein [Cyanobium sp. LEGE 06143]MBE9171813.1 hypothetical protein [Cyanobium sp. LEGE 06143]
MQQERRAIIHIGAPKAGSSSIQTFLKAHYERWQDHGILSLGMTGAKTGLNHRTLYFSFHRGSISRVDRMRFHSDTEYDHHRQLQQQLLAQEIACHDSCNTLIFSDEYLTRLDAASVQELRQFLECHGVTQFLVLAYVRDPGSLFLSSAQQSIKAHHELPSPIGWKQHFSHVLRTWNSVFPGCTLYRAYERSSLVQGSVVDDFLQSIFGLDADQSRENLATTTKSNRNLSMTAEGMALLLNYRRMFHREKANIFTPDTRQLILILQECSGMDRFEPPRLHQEWRHFIEDCHAQELLQLSTEFGLNYQQIDYDRLRQALLSPPRVPSPPTSDLTGAFQDVAYLVENISTEAYQALSLHVLHRMAQKAAENSKLKKALQHAGQPA